MDDDRRYRVKDGSTGDTSDEYTGSEAEAVEWAQQVADQRGWRDWQLQATDDGGSWYDVSVPDQQISEPPLS